MALGPFCNIAKVIEKDPAALHLANKVVIMGGAYFKQYADWNVMCDVPAADRMYQSLPNLECIGADVTHRLTDTGYLEDALVLHDVLVLYYLYDPTICAMQQIHTSVITEGLAKGLTLNVDAYGKTYLNSAYQAYVSGPPVLAASNVDVEKFHQFVRRDISFFQTSIPVI